MSDVLIRLKSSSSVDEEITCIQDLLQAITIAESNPQYELQENSCEELYFKSQLDKHGKKYSSVAAIFADESQLCEFTFYLFERRFGWSEYEGSTESYSSEGFRGILRKSKSFSIEDDSKCKRQLNCLLEELLHWLSVCASDSLGVLKAGRKALIKACSFPVVRSQILVHCMEWLLAIVVQCEQFTDKQFDIVKDMIMIGLQDVWSAIRRSCVTHLTNLLRKLTCPHVEQLFNSLIQMAQQSDLSWQAEEGVILGLTAFLQVFSWGDDQIYPKSSACLPPHCTLPADLKEPLENVLYAGLGNAQLSIRENSRRAFSYLLLKSNIKQLEKIFEAVLTKLSSDCLHGKHSMDADSDSNCTKSLGAYEAEGYLRVAELVVKSVPIPLIYCNWNLCFATFSWYLMHPASTVRQAASSVFKFLVAKDTTNVLFLKLVMQSLLADWVVDEKVLLRPVCEHLGHCTRHRFMGAPSQRGSIRRIGRHRAAPSALASCWEWREGRLLAYELILKFLITNHIHYMFPSCSFVSNSRTVGQFATEPAHMQRKPLPAETRPPLHRWDTVNRYEAPANRHFDLSRSLTETEHHQAMLNYSLPTRKSKSVSADCRDYAHSMLHKLRSDCKNTNDTEWKFKARIQNPTKHHTDEDNFLVKQRFSPWRASQDEDDGWISSMEFESFPCLLRQIFLQSMICLADQRWEIRRMSQQVLPLIVETMRFFDIKLIERFWHKCLGSSLSLQCYAACLSLKESLLHLSILKTCMPQCVTSSKKFEIRRSSTESIVCGIERSLPHLITQIVNIVKSGSFDKVTIAAVEVLLLATVHCPEVVCEDSFSVLLGFFKSLIYCRYGRACQASWMVQEATAEFDIECNLCFDADAQNDKQKCLQQIHNQAIADLHLHLLSYFNCCSADILVEWIPILVYSMSPAEVNVMMQLEIAQLLLKLCHFFKEKIQSLTDASEVSFLAGSNWSACINSSIDRISEYMKIKDLEMQVLKYHLDAVLVISQSISEDVCLTPVLAAIATRMKFDEELINLMQYPPLEHQDSHQEESLHLELLSNDIHQSPIDSVMPFEINGSEEESIHDLPVRESHALNLDSGTSLSITTLGLSGHDVSSHDATSDCDSDWDSYDEEEEEGLVNGIFSHFLLTLREQLSTTRSGSFGKQLGKCSRNEQKILWSLLANE